MMKGKGAADQVYVSIQEKVEMRKQRGIQPRLETILVEGDPASAYYARMKQRIAGKLGIAFHLHAFPADVTEEVILREIARLNEDPAVHGIMLELPLPRHLSAGKIEQTVSPAKDIDGVAPANKLAVMTGDAGLYPATPGACIRLLKHYGYPLEGRDVTLIGRGRTVGMPLFHMLQREQATVTVCHSRTPDIASHLAHADIAFVAAGRPGTVTRAMVHPQLIVVDAGINEIAGDMIVGDVAADVENAVAALSPVPGGVGTLTTAILFENLMKAIDIQLGEADGR